MKLRGVCATCHKYVNLDPVRLEGAIVVVCRCGQYQWMWR